MIISDDNIWWQFLMTISDDNFWWQFLMTISDDNFWWQSMMAISYDNFSWQFLMTISDDNFWWQFLMTIFDDNFWCQFLMTISDDDILTTSLLWAQRTSQILAEVRHMRDMVKDHTLFFFFVRAPLYIELLEEALPTSWIINPRWSLSLFRVTILKWITIKRVTMCWPILAPW